MWPKIATSAYANTTVGIPSQAPAPMKSHTFESGKPAAIKVE